MFYRMENLLGRFAESPQTLVYLVKRLSTEDCICYQPSTVIQCTACGSVTSGRVRVKCTQHPNTIFISDFDRCFHCNAPSCFLLSIPKK
ncbi:hypothetical protein LSTR_LSTR014380 [Laodelphax striatellus]|uniref:Uncharacterized protein n=1 Tax=Laodelphax striatellus TaxID=195883 RepID=A0A482WZF2_LAOST|nr:hypothetical protein LSTR_LSTR014380 [Laodelphax striatellus]